MSESRHARHRRRRSVAAGIGGMILALATQGPPVASAAGPEPPLGPAELSTCREARVMRPAVIAATVPAVGPLETILDDAGVVVGHDVRIGDLRLRLGPRALGAEAGDDRVVVGERASGATSVWLLNSRRGCVVWQRDVPGLVYDVGLDGAGSDLLLTAVEPRSRRYLGQVRMSVDTGVTTAMLEGTCLTPCEPNDATTRRPSVAGVALA